LRPDDLRALLQRVRRGAVTPAEAARAIAAAPLEQLGFATLDHQRALRTGAPEVVFGPGKSVPDLVAIVNRLYARTGLVLATRVSDAGREALLRAFPNARVYERSGAVVVRRHPPRPRGRVLVVCAGTSDLPVAEEAVVTAEALGSRVEWIADVGVAGLHRLLAHRERLRGARALVVVAGLEGALPSVVAGLVDRPVIAVPTSIGYGAHFGGLAPLLAMLNSCAPGVTVVNVNNGFGAGYAAHLVNVGGSAGVARNRKGPMREEDAGWVSGPALGSAVRPGVASRGPVAVRSGRFPERTRDRARRSPRRSRARPRDATPGRTAPLEAAPGDRREAAPGDRRRPKT